MGETVPALMRDNPNRGGALMLDRRPMPSPRPGGVVLRPMTAGVCGTDLQILRGLRDDPAPVLGHEGDAIVEAVGDGVTDLAVGDRVLLNPTCPADQDMILGHTLDGLWQGAVALPAAAVAGGMVRRHRLPPAPLPALVEPLAAVLYALELVSLSDGPPRSLAVIGGGIIGLLLAAAAPLVLDPAPKRISVLTADRHRLHWAEARGLLAPETGAGGGFADHAFDAAVVAVSRPFGPEAVDRAVRMVRPGGTVDLFGGLAGSETASMLPGVDIGRVRRANACGTPYPPVTVPVRDRDGRPLVLTGHRGVGWHHLSAAVDLLLSDHGAKLGAVVSHRLGLAAAATLLEDHRRHGRRRYEGEPWIKLAIDVAEPDRPIERWSPSAAS